MFESRTARGVLDGRTVRLQRLFSAGSGRSLIVPLDHSVTIGPLGNHAHADSMAAMLSEVGADAIVVHKGRARRINPAHLRALRLIVHLSAGTELSVDTTGKVLVASVEESLVLGADAVSVHVNIGSPTEAQQLADFGAVARECARLGMPLMAMMYHRGLGGTQQPPSTATLAHLAAIATDLGADIVKLDYAGDPEAMNAVVDTCPLPIVVAGGASTSDDDAMALGAQICRSRVAGLSFGRQIFHADDPARVAGTLARSLHDRSPARSLAPA